MIKKFILLAILFAISCKSNLIPAKNSTASYTTASGDVWIGEPYSGFVDYKVVQSKEYMISTADVRASKVGAEILAKGGNAIDAAIAAELVLNVVEPQSSGIGGGTFMLYYDAKNKNTVYFNGRERAPLQANEKMFLDKNGKVRNFYDIVGGGLSVGTPGALKAWKISHEKYGKLPWKDLFAPAIAIANEGFELDARIHVILEALPYLNHFDGMKIYFEPNGKPKKIGTLIKNPQLAKTFEIIANQGIKPFYKGKIANDIVDAVRNSKTNPGYLSLPDLAKYKIKAGAVLCHNYRKHKICSMPMPSSGGVALLQTLGILENFDLSKIKPSSPEAVHLIAEASRLAYADRNEYAADLPNVPVSQMLDKKYLKQRANLINVNHTMTNVKPGIFGKEKLIVGSSKTAEKPSTTHIAIVDKYGNAVSMTSTIEYLFGSVLMVDGFMLNNQLTDFSLAPEIDGKKVANRLEPLKQPRSSMTPTFVFDEKGNLVMAIGSPGGPRIIQYVLKAIIAHLDWGMNIQEAISLPNYVALNDQIELEDRTTLVSLQQPLEKLGHKVVVTDITSGLHGITIGKSGLEGGVDPRRHGLATGQ